MQNWVWQYKTGNDSEVAYRGRVIRSPAGRVAHCVDDARVDAQGALNTPPICGDTPPNETSDWSGGNTIGKPHCRRCEKVVQARGLVVADGP